MAMLLNMEGRTLKLISALVSCSPASGLRPQLPEFTQKHDWLGDGLLFARIDRAQLAPERLTDAVLRACVALLPAVCCSSKD